jgi:transcriptional regulator with XRE-family HTH domain
LFTNKSLPLSYSDKKAQSETIILLADKIKQLREEKQLFQRQLAEVLEIDTPMYCKIERGSRPIKRIQVVTLAKFLSTDETELLTLWLADKVLEVLVG